MPENVREGGKNTKIGVFVNQLLVHSNIVSGSQMRLGPNPGVVLHPNKEDINLRIVMITGENVDIVKEIFEKDIIFLAPPTGHRLCHRHQTTIIAAGDDEYGSTSYG